MFLGKKSFSFPKNVVEIILLFKKWKCARSKKTELEIAKVAKI